MKKHIERVRQILQVDTLMASRNDRQIIASFAEDHGFVYFGYVSQTDDEHHIIRGLTTSIKHHDSHYVVGSYEGYDIAFVERSDILQNPKKRLRRSHRWYIMEFDLKYAKVDIPHIFIGLHSHSELFYMQLFTKFPNLRPLKLGSHARYPNEFFAQYRVYGQPARGLDIEKIITPEVSTILTKHFNGLAIEIVSGSLLIYSEHAHPSSALLNTILQNGTWLARTIDIMAQRND